MAMSEGAKLPESLRKAPQRYLRDLAVGETAYIWFNDLEPDSEGRCFLNPDAKIYDSGEHTRVTVERREDGDHVTLRSVPGISWEFGGYKTEGHYPAASVTVVPHPLLNKQGN